MVEEKLLTAKDLAESLGLSIETIWRYTREKRIPYLEMGPRQYRYYQSNVMQALGTRGEVREEQATYDSQTKMNYKDFAKLPEESNHTLELIDGTLVREPSPTYQHQRVSRRLEQILIAYFAKIDSRGEVFSAPLDVYLDEHTVVQPDIFYLPSDRPARSNPVNSLPELVVEILSPSSLRTDRVRKLNRYQLAGVKHYWLLDPDNKTIECLKLDDGKYTLLISLDSGILNHPDFPEMRVVLEELFADV